MGDSAACLDDTLNRLGALDRFCEKTGITREGLLAPEHRNSIFFLQELKVQPVLQRLVLEYAAHLIVDGPGLACPVCGESLTTDAAAAATLDRKAAVLCEVARHIYNHEFDVSGMLDAAEASQVGKSFSVSASMLGGYFSQRCSRALVRSSRRICGVRREVDVHSLIDTVRRAHTTRGVNFEAELLERLSHDGLPTGWDTHSTIEPAAAAAAAAAAITTGESVRFVSEREWDAKYAGQPASGKLGVLIDLGQRAKRRCGCSACLTGLAEADEHSDEHSTSPPHELQPPIATPSASVAAAAVVTERSSCRLRSTYEEVSLEALRATYRVPCMLTQLELKLPECSHAEPRRRCSRLDGPCTAAGECPRVRFWQALLEEGRMPPEAVTLGRGYVDFLLLMPLDFTPTNAPAGSADAVTGVPSGEDVDAASGATVPKRYQCTVIDAKATDKVKLGAKVQVTIYHLLLSALRECLWGGPPGRPMAQEMVLSDVGGVWLYGQRAPVPFGLGVLRRMLRRFWGVEMPQLLHSGVTVDTYACTLGLRCFSCRGAVVADPTELQGDVRRLLAGWPAATVHELLEMGRGLRGTGKTTSGEMRPLSLSELETATLISPQPDEHARRLFATRLLVRYDAEHRPYHLPSIDPPAASPVLAALRLNGTSHHNGRSSLTLPYEPLGKPHTKLFLCLLNDPYVQQPYAWALELEPPRMGSADRDWDVLRTIDLPKAEYTAFEHKFVTALKAKLDAARSIGNGVALYVAEKHEYTTLLRLLMAGAMHASSYGTAGPTTATAPPVAPVAVVIRPPAAAASVAAEAAVAQHARRCLECLLTLMTVPELVQVPQQTMPVARSSPVVPSHCVVLAEDAPAPMSSTTCVRASLVRDGIDGANWTRRHSWIRSI